MGRHNFGRSNNYYDHNGRENDHWRYYKGRGAFNRGRRPYKLTFNERIHIDENMVDINRHGQFSRHNRHMMRRETYNQEVRRKKTNAGCLNTPPQTQGWHQITVTNFNGANEVEIIASIKKHVDDFTPVMSSFLDTLTFVFYLEDNKDATSAMLNLSNIITLNNGQKIKITITTESPEYAKPDKDEFEIIKKVISRRYNTEMNRIDLKCFHKDPELIQSKIYIPLYNYQGLCIIINIITTNILNKSEIEIDLSCNKIFNISPLKELVHYEIRYLNLENNKLTRTFYLKQLLDIQIAELNLKGNTICNMLKRNHDYASMVRKFIPSLKYLDGIELPKLISFEVNANDCILPKSLGSYCGSEEVKGLIEKFILKYYEIFECGDRQMLEAAYTEEAFYSSVVVNPHPVFSKMNGNLLVDCRNLIKLVDPKKRFNLLIQGRKDIINHLWQMPKAHHNLQSFIIDVPIAELNFWQVCLSGVVTVFVGMKPVLRSFSRTMIIVPLGTGFSISNELYFLGQPSPDQKYEISMRSIISSLPSQDTNSVSADEEKTDSVFIGLENDQINIVKQFSQHSNMKPQFSLECLKQFDWDFQKAAELFMSMLNENKIPMDYFQE